MTAFRRRPNKKNWFRFAMKLGLLATDAAVLSSIGRMLSDRDNAGDTFRSRAEISGNHKGGRSHTSTLLVGFAIGIAVGMLYAPVSGEEARNAIRERAVGVKEKVSDVAAWAGRGGPSTGRSTGTYAD